MYGRANKCLESTDELLGKCTAVWSLLYHQQNQEFRTSVEGYNLTSNYVNSFLPSNSLEFVETKSLALVADLLYSARNARVIVVPGTDDGERGTGLCKISKTILTS